MRHIYKEVKRAAYLSKSNKQLEEFKDNEAGLVEDMYPLMGYFYALMDLLAKNDKYFTCGGNLKDRYACIYKSTRVAQRPSTINPVIYINPKTGEHEIAKEDYESFLEGHGTESYHISYNNYEEGQVEPCQVKVTDEGDGNLKVETVDWVITPDTSFLLGTVTSFAGSCMITQTKGKVTQYSGRYAHKCDVFITNLDVLIPVYNKLKLVGLTSI